MLNLFLAGAGGFLGAAARYLLGGWILHHATASKFPWSTFVVNILGCFTIGLLAGVAEKYGAIGPAARVFLFTGVLGGFTTFSAFGFETHFLLRRGNWGIATLYVSLSVILGLFAVWGGFRAVPWNGR